MNDLEQRYSFVDVSSSTSYEEQDVLWTLGGTLRLTKVTVSNYRSIGSKTTFELHNMTTLIGPNNEGKSNLLRAIALGMRFISRWSVSPDYTVFRLAPDAPMDPEYLLMFLKSEQGRADINRESRGAVRRRLYIEGVRKIKVPVPLEPEAWSALIASFAAVRRHLRELPQTAFGALGAFEAAIFSPRPTEESS
jgi:hypothetical protein